MADHEYESCHYSITCRTDDLAVVYCLRAICDFCERGVKSQIAWGGTSAANWRSAGNNVTLRFSDPNYRVEFVNEATRLLKAGSWKEVSRNDADPASRQRQRRTMNF